ncbi:hypothetical protein MIT9_P0455 [Methylomarinovum caldicuralii]|uniref:Uncharacterized protein n=1 Tax=Methylomarinovum caldicuralii TaxID=438856 RepID=A0AAU9CN12_9GAMM|nr:DUF5335 domain-containing protein [Methylomarinovum caldicuralii]BCX80877.1 hypothetical protein MIT9_P0455 [Methylomarinovum caldicuralii]
MATRALPKSEWEAYFDHVSKHLKAETAEIEVASINLGDQIEAEWVPFYGVSYDPKDDVIEFVLEGVDHLVPHPKEVYVDDSIEGLRSIKVVGADGVRHIAKLKEVLKLPPPDECV